MEKLYENVFLLAKTRGYIAQDKSMSLTELNTALKSQQYVSANFLDPVSQKPVVIYLFSPEAEHPKHVEQIEKLLNILKPTIVLCFCKDPVSRRIIVRVKTKTHLQVSFYLHINLNNAPDHIRTGKHTIMTREEIKVLEHDLNIPNVICLPRIIEHDVQCIWIGANIGDVIRVEKRNVLTGKSLHYFFVSSFNVELVESDKPGAVETEDPGDESDDADDADEPDEVNEVNEVNELHGAGDVSTKGGKDQADIEDVEEIDDVDDCGDDVGYDVEDIEA